MWVWNDTELKFSFGYSHAESVSGARTNTVNESLDERYIGEHNASVAFNIGTNTVCAY